MHEHFDGPAGPRSARAAATKILIIEDDAAVRDVIAAALKSGGYEPVVASNGREGIASFKRETPALVITDILMPDTEGIQTILELRRLRPDVKIIAISGVAKEYLEMAAKLGASAVLAKPFPFTELLETAARILGD